MGGNSKKPVTGYKYFAGIQMILCHGQIDAVKKILVDDDKTLINGNYTAGSHQINKENLFGGESSQGGISGIIDVMDGSQDQEPNAYISEVLEQQKKGSSKYLPAYRGVAGLVLHSSITHTETQSTNFTRIGGSSSGNSSISRVIRSWVQRCGMYLGMNPYLKTWKTLVQRIHKTSDGKKQWYDEKAAIGSVSFSDIGQIAFVLDDSGSMSYENMSNMKTGINSILAGLGDNGIDVMVQAINAGVQICRNATTQDIANLQAFVNSLSASGGTSATSAYGNINSFFTLSSFNQFAKTNADTDTEKKKEKLVLTLSDGEMQDVATAKQTIARTFSQVKFIGLGMGTVGSLNDFDNTGNPVQVVNADGITAAINGVFFNYVDMNPAHIIRECLTDGFWGMGKAESELDEQSFTKAADTLYAERLGMSVSWTQESSIESFLDEIRNHINAVIYEDPRTGLTVLKLIRDDYDESALVTLDESCISDVTEFQRSMFSELMNQITVTYTNIATGEDGTITVQDTALIAMQNDVKSKSIQYKGFSNILNAGRIAMRDLKVAATPLISAEITVMRSKARNFRQGDVFKWNWKDYKVDGVIMRVLAVDLGNGKSNTVTLTCTQDIFAMPNSTVATIQPEVPQNNEIQPITQQISFDVPYLELVQRQGQRAIDDLLQHNPDASFLGIACGRPDGAAVQNAQLYIQSENTGNYLRDSSVDFCPVFTVANDLDYLDTQIRASSYRDLGLLDPAEDLPVWAQLNNEIVSITQLEFDDATKEVVLTVKRGALDTIPSKHAKDSVLYVWDILNGGSETEHVMTEPVSAKLLTSSLSALLDEKDAQAFNTLMHARAIRPYPPANIRINGEYYPDAVDNQLNIEWSHRNRIQQTSGDYLGWFDGAVSLEPDTTYHLELVMSDLDDKRTTLLDENIGDVSSYSFDLSTVQRLKEVYITLKSVRNGYDCYQVFQHTLVSAFSNPFDLKIVRTTNLSAPFNIRKTYKVDPTRPFNLRKETYQ